MDRYAFEQVLKAHLKTVGWSQAAVARRLGYAPDTFNKWVRGINRMPSEAIAAFSQLLGLTPSDMTQLLTLAGYTVPTVLTSTYPSSPLPMQQPERSTLLAYLQALCQRFGRWADQPEGESPLFTQGDELETTPDLYLALQAEALPMRVAEFRPHASKIERRSEELLAALRRAERNIILGPPGSGKTSALERVAWLTAQQTISLIAASASAQPATPLIIPLFVRLADYQGEPDLLPLLRRALNHTGAMSLDNAALRAYLRIPQIRFLLLLDGLNEFERTVEGRGVKAVRLHLEDYPAHTVYLTCRVADFDPIWYQRYGFRHWEIQPLLDEIEEWQDQRHSSDLRTYLRRHLGEMAGQRLYYRLRSDERLYSLARLPLFLWMLKETGGADGALPYDRGQLIQRFVRAQRLLGSIPKALRPHAERVVELLGWTMHQQGGLEIDDHTLYTVLATVRGLQSYDLDTMRTSLQSAGLLVDLAHGHYRLLHQLVQEYGAAAYLVRQSTCGEQICQLATQEWWREVLILALWLRPDLQTPAYLYQLMTHDSADVRVRAEAGLILAHIGDPRFPVQSLPRVGVDISGTAAATVQLIRPTLVTIPAGTATLGGEDAEAFDTELPACTVQIHAFALAIYPVTNAEYRWFMEDGGYQNAQWWLRSGWGWVQGQGRFDTAATAIFLRFHQKLRNGVDQLLAEWQAQGELITEGDAEYYRWLATLNDEAYLQERTREFQKPRQAPATWHDRNLNQANQPVVGVNWYEALAYAAWLRHITQQTYRLPTEAEWEWAAQRGVAG